jgi:type I restriction enzyme R subunit
LKSSCNSCCTTDGLGFPQTKALTIVDREALDDDALIFRREGGGWQRLDRVFAGELDGVLREFKREVWAA